MMTNDQVMSVARSLLQVAGTFLTTYGIMNGQQWEPIAGGVLMIVPVVWSMFAHSKTGTIQAAASLPEVKEVVTTPVLARDIPSPKVVARGS